jgi:cell division protein FtsL
VNKVVLAENELSTYRIHKQNQETYRYTKPKQRPAKRPQKKGKTIVSLVFIAIAVMFMLLRFSAINESQIRVNELQAELKSITDQNERLRVEVASLKAVARVEDIAKNRLNMIEPGSSQIIYIND